MQSSFSSVLLWLFVAEISPWVSVVECFRGGAVSVKLHGDADDSTSGSHAANHSHAQKHQNNKSWIDTLDEGGAPEVCEERSLCSVGQDGCSGEFIKTMVVCDRYLSQLRTIFHVAEPLELLRRYKIQPSKLYDLKEEGEGKSGAGFISASEMGGEFVMKTMTANDVDSFRGIAASFVEYLSKHSHTSNLVRVFCVLKTSKGRYWMLMNNWLPVKFPTIYDIKGSTIGRITEPPADGKPIKVGKDQNWENDGGSMHLTSRVQNTVMKGLRADADYLANKMLLDYSLIVGQVQFSLPRCEGRACRGPICLAGAGCFDLALEQKDKSKWQQVHDFYCEPDHNPKQHTGHTCVGTVVLGGPMAEFHFECFGIIDILKSFGTKSSWEYILKGGTLGRDISNIPPPDYAERFTDAMRRKVFKSDGATRLLVRQPDRTACRMWGMIKPEQVVGPRGAGDSGAPRGGLAMAVVVVAMMLTALQIGRDF